MFNSSILWCGVLWCFCGAIVTSSTAVTATTDGKDEKNATRGVDEFLASLMQMIGTVLNSDARYSQLNDGDEKSVSGRPNRPVADYFETGRPPFPQEGNRPYLENGNRPYLGNGDRPYLENGNRPYPPPPQYPENGGRPGFLGPPYPYGPRPGYPGQYPSQNSVLQALSSISQHDDLRCVPRLLCEVSSGTRPSSGYYQPGYNQKQQQQQSSIPFLSKEALITLLTVLNFVDDSPLLMFGRAALLGYNARGDPRSCTTAYPTCPRDPDQLINYLNNHNGGFFRFFNQQLPQYVPQYGTHQQLPQPPFQRPHPYPGGPHNPGNPFQGPQNPGPPYPGPHNPGPPYPELPYQRPPYYQRPTYPQKQYAPQYPRPPQQHFGTGDYKTRSDRQYDDQQKPRILIGSPSQYYDVPSVQDLALDTPRPPMIFPSDDHSASANSVSSFVFPSDQYTDGNNRQSKRIKMVFPDRTGTGGLRADLDKYGNYKGVYYADGTIKFVDDRDSKRPSKIRLPQSPPFSSSSSSARPADHFDVFGERLPFERRNKFQFPRTI